MAVTNGHKESFTIPDGTLYKYTYGDNGELREIMIDGVSGIVISEYQWGRPRTMLYPGGSKRELEYDGLMRLKTLSAKDPRRQCAAGVWRCV